MIDGVGGHQSSPSMALWDGGGLVAWANTSSTGSNRIAVQALDGQGQATGKPLQRERELIYMRPPVWKSSIAAFRMICEDVLAGAMDRLSLIHI